MSLAEVIFPLSLISKNKRFSKKTGNLAWSFIAGYGVIRFMTSFMRINRIVVFMGLGLTQIICIIMVITGLYMLYKNNVVKHK